MMQNLVSVYWFNLGGYPAAMAAASASRRSAGAQVIG